jgi:hypothetical protein
LIGGNEVSQDAVNPEGTCPHGPEAARKYVASSGPSGDGPSGLMLIGGNEVSQDAVNPEGTCPHGPEAARKYVASSGPSGDGPSGWITSEDHPYPIPNDSPTSCNAMSCSRQYRSEP